MIAYNVLFVNKKIGETMKVYGVEFEITKECLNKQMIEVFPGEGVAIPLVLDRIDGFYDYLVRNQCIRKKVIDMIYIFSIPGCGETLCTKYIDGDVSIIQNVGKIDFCQEFSI